MSLPEVYLFQGLCNRLNGLLTARLRWPDGFRIRWQNNMHCPVNFDDLFEDFPYAEVTHEQGDWQDEQYYTDHPFKHCHHHLCAGSSIEDTRQALAEITSSLICQPSSTEPLSQLGITARFHSAHPPDPEAIVLLADHLTRRSGIRKVLLSCDSLSQRKQISDQLKSIGIDTQQLGQAMTHDYDRSRSKIEDFINTWHQLNRCATAIASRVETTTLDASRILGNEVWTLGTPEWRHQNNCDLFKHFGQGLLCVEATRIKNLYRA